MFPNIGQRLADDPELVIPRPNLPALLLAGAWILFLYDLSIVLEDIGQPCRCQDLLPQIVGLESVRIRRVSCTIVVAFVKGQEPRALARELGAHLHLAVIDGEVDHAASELKQLLARI